MPPAKRIISLIIRILISAGLLVYVGTQIQFYDTPDEPGLFSLLQRIQLIWFVPAFILLFSQIWLLSLRWLILLRAQGIHLPYGQVFGLNYVGIFFNSFLPTSLGGDIIKAALVTQTTQLRTKAIISILADRFTGFISLSLLCLLATSIMPTTTTEFHNLKTAILLMAVIVLINILIGFVVLGSSWSNRLKLFNIGIFREIREAIQNYRGKIIQCLGALAITLVMHIIVVLVNVFYAWALGINTVPIWYYFVFIPIIAFITTLPISVGGWGVGEMSYGYLLGFWGVPLTLAIALSVLFRISITLWSLPGAWYIIRPAGIKKPVPAVETSLPSNS